MPVILDVDTGIDDSLALMLACSHPDLEVRAVTCVGGNVGVDQVVINTLRTLDFIGEHDVPVGRGMSHPMIGEPASASQFHGLDGLGDVNLPQPQRTADPRHAVDLLRDQLLDSADDITVVALAPLTNIAALIRVFPEAADKIKRIVWMGGAALVGNVTPAAEYNAWLDPEAAHIVLTSSIPITIYPLEPFYQAAVHARDIERLSAVDTPRAGLLSALLRHIAAASRGEDRLPSPGAATLGDAGAVCTLLAPELTESVTTSVGVETTGRLTRGQTVIDLRRAHTDLNSTPDLDGGFDSTQAVVVRSVHERAFVDLFFEHVCPEYQPQHC